MENNLYTYSVYLMINVTMNVEDLQYIFVITQHF